MSDKRQKESELIQQRFFDDAKAGNIDSNQYGLENYEQMHYESYSVDMLRSIDDIPIADIKAINSLSIPEYYTAYPNPFLENFVDSSSLNKSTPKNVHPMTEDVVAGKNDPLYFAHSYSTKVPPDAIIPYIMHYTTPGDVVLDGFCGTGMTGIAAQLCGDRYRPSCGRGEVGRRKAILVDLSPAATFISAGTNMISKLAPYLRNIEETIQCIRQENTELLTTRHVGWPRGVTESEKRVNAHKCHGPEFGEIQYVVWSDVFSCSECGEEIIYWDMVFEGPGKKIPKEKYCGSCGAEQSIKSLERIWSMSFDYELGRSISQAKQVPTLINYSVGKKRYEKYPDAHDLKIISKLANTPMDSQPPLVELPHGFNTQQPIKSHGFTHVHHFFTRRNLFLLSKIWSRICATENKLQRLAGLYLLTGMIQRVCRLNRYMPNHDRHVGPLSGTLYVSQLTAEIPATNYALSRLKDLLRCESTQTTGEGIRISTQSSTSLSNLNDQSIDYIFTDPPFGGNLNYSELNVLIEAWIGVLENRTEEAVVNDVQRKTLADYRNIMSRSFREFYRVLKAGKWMTVEFHNSQNIIWNIIQETLTNVGFIIADVRTLDKKKGTTKQLSYSSSVKQDLVITVYKPNDELENRFKLTAGTKDGVWNFVHAHLEQLPIFVSANDQSEVIVERQDYLLFDRMVAFHVQRGFTVPISAAEFYAGLGQHFIHRDNMYFLLDQVDEYDKNRTMVRGIVQTEITVSDEASAIAWLRQELTDMPQTFQDIHPHFLKEISGWHEYEEPLELSELLEQNFLLYDGIGEVPNQIYKCFLTDTGDSYDLNVHDPVLKGEAKNRWYVPDPGKAEDLGKIRERALLREFEKYRQYKKKDLKVLRLEAIRVGFKRAWEHRDYTTILSVAEKISEEILQEDPTLLMWYDHALTRSREE